MSGDWVLESATSTGGRSASGTQPPAGTHAIMSTTISGAAAFNCGRQCRILQKLQTLTIDEAILEENARPAVPVRLVSNGVQTPVNDSFNPGGMIPVTTKWNRDELEIVSSTGSHAYTQRLTMHDGRLVVVTSINRDDEPPVTYTYKRR